MKKFVFFIFSISQLIGYAQTDNLRMVSYNLLNYRNYTSFCTVNNNNPVVKDNHMVTIINYLQPDIMVCNEIGGNSALPVDFLLNNAFNKNGGTKYAKAQFANNSFSYLVNMVYYNQNKLELHSQSWINKDLNNDDIVRIIDVYRFYYKDSLLNAHADTVFFTVLAAHLKAGNSSSDANQRSLATDAIMDYVKNDVLDDNVFLLGDLNTYKSQEQCYQNLINYSTASYSFKDPINTPGQWNNNSTYASVHTQSTHTSGGCFSGGGLDDRFDHILVSPAVMNNTDKIEYVNNTYITVGNDGQHFNQSIIAGTNNSVPANVLTALYGMSDHLPVVIEFGVQLHAIGNKEFGLNESDIKFNNPVSDNISIQIRNQHIKSTTCILSDLSGRQIKTQELDKQNHLFSGNVQVSDLQSGIYLITFQDNFGNSVTKKIMID